MNKRLTKEMKPYYVDTEDDETSDDDSSYSNARIHHARGKRDHLERKRHRSIKESFNMHNNYEPPLKLQRGRIKDEEPCDDDSLHSNGRIHHVQDKREHHNCLERKRRQTIKESFDMLRDAVPPLRNHSGRVSRAQILKGGAEHIMDMKTIIANKKEEIINLKEDNVFWENKNKILEMELPNQLKYSQSLNGSSSVSSKRTLIVPSSLSSKRIVNNTSDLCSRKSVNVASVEISARNDNTTLCSLDSNNSTICSDSNHTETDYNSSSDSTINDNGTSSSGSEAEADNESAYSNGANIDNDSWSFKSVRIASDIKLPRSLWDLEDNLPDYGSCDNIVSLSELCPETSNNSSYLNSPRMFDAVSLSVTENLNEKVDKTACSRRLVRVDSEDNENNRNVDSDRTLSSLINVDDDDDDNVDNFPSGFDLIRSLRFDSAFETIPSSENSIDFNFGENDLDLYSSDACPKPSKRFRN